MNHALSLGIATDDPLPLARIHNQAGRVHYISGDYNKALEHFASAKNFGDQANAIKESLYETNGRALIQMVAGWMCKAFQDWGRDSRFS